MTRGFSGWAAIVVGSLWMVSAQPAAQAVDPGVALRAAIETETVKGDLTAAIEQYKKLAQSTDRVVAAQALLRLADCYQKLGDAQAQAVYERVVREFADQKDLVAIARARMGSRRTNGTGMVARQLWTTTNYSQVSIASDGRRAAVAEGSSSEIQIREFATGQVTRLKITADPASGAYPEWPVLSPDQTQVAYAYAGPDTGWNYQVRIKAAQPDAPSRPVGHQFPYMSVNAWAPDGKSVLVTNFGEGNVGQVAWVSTTDGAVRVLKSLTWQTGRPVLSPDGKFIAYDVRRVPGMPNSEIFIMAVDGSSESVVAPAPGVNASPVWAENGSRLLFKSDRSGTFGIWSIAVRNGKGDGAATRLKADVGDIDLIGFNGTSLLYGHRSGSTDIFAVDLDSQTGTVRGDITRLLDTFVGSNLNPAASPDRKSLAFHRRTAATNQWSTLVIRSMESGAERIVPTVFRYAGTPVWVDGGQSIVQVARDAENNRTIYKVDLKTGDVTRMINSGSMAPGASVSPDGRRAYAGDTFVEHPSLAVIDVASGTRTQMSHAGDATRGVGVSPDGRSVAFVTVESLPTRRTHLYVADADGGNVRAILTTDKQDEVPVFGGGMRWSPDSRFIYFVRGTGSLWRIAASGGTPVLVGQLGNIRVRTIDVASDGRQLTFGTDSGFTVEIWALENVLPAPKANR
jgi:Tol biopolymer transport system component